MKLKPATGAVLAAFTVATGPLWVAFDGANVWVVTYQNNAVAKL
jgi:hypothetical protein